MMAGMGGGGIGGGGMGLHIFGGMHLGGVAPAPDQVGGQHPLVPAPGFMPPFLPPPGYMHLPLGLGGGMIGMGMGIVAG